jgi:hypothetical protein
MMSAATQSQYVNCHQIGENGSIGGWKQTFCDILDIAFVPETPVGRQSAHAKGGGGVVTGQSASLGLCAPR